MRPRSARVVVAIALASAPGAAAAGPSKPAPLEPSEAPASAIDLPEVEQLAPELSEPQGEPSDPSERATPQSGRAMAQAQGQRSERLPWIRRFAPERHMIVVGVFGGVFLAHEAHDLYDPRTAPPEPLWQVSPDVGARVGYYPLRSLGFEAEFSAVPTRMRTSTNDPVFVYGVRGHAVVQLPYARLTPFLLMGAGLLGVSSHLLLLGDDVDPAVHYGGGLKLAITRWLDCRVEARNILSAASARQDTAVPHVQVLGGLTATIRRPKPPPPPAPAPVDPDRDRDGFLNDQDECPDAVGVRPHGCPDTDGDGFRDADDPCPRQPGDATHGCPDSDADGFRDPYDRCVQEPEAWNGYLDMDGCADDVPEPIKRFTGTIEGIAFDFGKATIRPSSTRVLDEAIAVLREYPDVRVRIIGHTDDLGSQAVNLELSGARADAVAAYLIAGGVAADRIEAEGRGASEPRVPNDSDENRARNRRIDFEVLSRRGP